MFNEINTRIAMKRDTEANWTSNNPIPLDGEVILVDTEDKVRFKVGDGEKTYSQLLFSDLILGEEEGTAFPGDKGKTAYEFSEKIFIVEYKNTTFQECYDAAISGKLLLLNHQGALFNLFLGSQDLLAFSSTNCAKYTDGFFHVGACIFLSKDNIWETVSGPYFVPDEGLATGILKRTNIYGQLEQAVDGKDYISPGKFSELFGVYIAEYGQADDKLIDLIKQGVTCFVKRMGYLYPLYISADIDNDVRFCGFAGIQDAPHNNRLVVEFIRYFEDGRGDNGWEVFKTYNTVQLNDDLISSSSSLVKNSRGFFSSAIAGIDYQTPINFVQGSNIEISTSDSQVVVSTTGLAQLDTNGRVLSSQLPSYVDDVIEGYYYDSKFYKESTYITQIIGETGKIYVDLSTNKTYRWSGSAFVIISETLALGETSSTAYRGDKGKDAYDHATAKGSAFNSGLYKITTNSEGHVTAATAVTKTDITALDIPAQDTWEPNSATSEGYVASSNGQTGVFWRTDSNGNPSWGQIVRGIDYWTEEDKNEIKQYVEDAILGGAW